MQKLIEQTFGNHTSCSGKCYSGTVVGIIGDFSAQIGCFSDDWEEFTGYESRTPDEQR